MAALDSWKMEYNRRCLRAVFYTILALLGISLTIRLAVQTIPGVSGATNSGRRLPFIRPLLALTVASASLTAAVLTSYSLIPRTSSGWLSMLSLLFTPTGNQQGSQLILCFTALLSGTCLFLPSYMTLLCPSRAAIAFIFTPWFHNNAESPIINELCVFFFCLAAANCLFAVCSHLGNHDNWLQLPAIDQPSSQLLFTALVDSCRKALGESWRVLRWFYPSFWLLGGPVCAALASCLHAVRDPSGQRCVNTLAHMLLPFHLSESIVDGDSFFLWLPLFSLLVGFLCRLPLLLVSRVVGVVLTARLDVPVEPLNSAVDLSTSVKLSLPDYLPCRQHPLLQRLLLSTLCSTVRHNAHERRVFFQLSQPGGHAHTCNRLVTVCFQHLRQLCDAIDGCLGRISAGSQPALSRRVVNTAVMAGLTDHSGVVHSDHVNTPQTRHKSPLLDDVAPNRSGAVDMSCASPENTLPLSTSLARYGDICCYCVRILRHLAAAALHEDQYGVLQQHLHELFTLLARLHETLLQCRRHIFTSTTDKSLTAVYNSLLHSTVTALHHTSTVYRPHLASLTLDSGTAAKLYKFADYLD